MINFKKETYLILLFSICLTTLSVAYFIEYFLGYQPCNLCLIERIPYILALIILLINYKFKKNEIFLCVLLLLIFLFSFFISVYHLSIEQGLINESSVCGVNDGSYSTSKDEILKSLQQINLNCKDVAIRIFGLSLTSYNILVSILMFVISVKIYFIYDKIKNKN
jgi:disulfide bond formation protein DsbB